MVEEVTGKMPVPHTEEKERASFYLFMSQLCNACWVSLAQPNLQLLITLSTINYQLSTINYPLSTIHYQLSTIH